MRKEQYDGSLERTCVIGLITRTVVLAAVTAAWKPGGCFASRWSNVVAEMCVDYYRRHRRAPGRAVEGLFLAFRGTQEARGDAKAIQHVEKFLESLSHEYEAQEEAANDDWLIDRVGEIFNSVQLRALIEAMTAHLDRGDWKDAEELRAAHRRLEIGAGCAIDVLSDREGVEQALAVSRSDPLVKYPGDLGRFFGRVFDRDRLVAFQAPEKRGKSFALIDVAWRAMTQRRRTLFFAAGDMSRHQMAARFAARAAGRPLRPGTYRFPRSIAKAGDDPDAPPKVEYEDRTAADVLTVEEVMRAYQEVRETRVRDDLPYLEMECHPAGHLGVADVRARCLRCAEAGRPVDVVVIDYADLLNPPPGHRDNRDKINATWVEMRALAMELHCLVVTATQANARSYLQHTQGMHNFSEDKRKLAHASGVVGINATPTEKVAGIQRLNWLVLRDEEYSTTRCVHVAGCPAISSPFIRSTF